MFSSYNHLLRLHLLISRKRNHKQQQVRNPPRRGVEKPEGPSALQPTTENRTDVYNECVANAKPQNHFHLLMKYIHLGDNANPDQNNKMLKIRSFQNCWEKTL